MRLSFLISLFLSLIGVLIVQQLFSTKAVEAGQNTYLGFIGITFVTPFILLSLFITFRYFFVIVGNMKDKLTQWFFILTCIGLIIVFAYFVIQYKSKIIAKPALYFPPLNDKTYAVYFNFYTFAFIHTICALFGGFFGLAKKKNKAN